MKIDQTKLAAHVAELLTALERTSLECGQTASALLKATEANREQLLGVLHNLQWKLVQLDKMLASVQKQLDQQTSDKVTE